MPNFDLHSRYALITYAQCGDLSPTAVGEFFERLKFKCVIGRENHADGGIHLHCFVDFGRKRRFRRSDVFDVEGRHPNIQGSRGTPEAGYDYAIKDDDVCYKSLDRPGEGGERNSGSRDKWSTITGAQDREQFWELVHELDPKSAACSFTQLQKYCDWKFAPIPAAYEHPDGITFVGGELDGRDRWLSQSGVGTGEPLVGKSGVDVQPPPPTSASSGGARGYRNGVCAWVSAMTLGPAYRPGPASCQSSRDFC